MPYLPLPQDLSNGCPLDGGPLPVSSVTDVQGTWANEIQQSQTAPVRNAIQAGQEAALEEYQRRSRYAAAQSDPGRATDEYLDEILEENVRPRQKGQSDVAARASLFATPPVITPAAVCVVANTVLAPYSNVPVAYVERSDGWFLCGGEAPWSSHVFASADNGTAFCTPNYPDRPQIDILFSSPGVGIANGTGAIATATLVNGAISGIQIVNGGSGYPSGVITTIVGSGSGAAASATVAGGAITSVAVTASGSGYTQYRRPPGAMPNPDSYGRWFLLRTPDISVVDSEIAAAYDVIYLTFVGGGGTGATAVVSSITNGVITGVVLTSGGTGYTTNPTISITSATGSGAVIIVNALAGSAVSQIYVQQGGSGYAPLDNEPQSGAETVSSVGGFFCGGLGGTGGGSFNPTDQNITNVFNFDAVTVDGIYNSLISAVNAAVGASIRWDLVADPQLVP